MCQGSLVDASRANSESIFQGSLVGVMFLKFRKINRIKISILLIALDPPRTFLRSKKKKLLRSDAKYIQAIYSSRLGLKNIDAHCKIILNDGITQPTCNHKEFIQQTICNHNYLLIVYRDIASNEYTLYANKDPKANENNENVPDEIIVGHLSTRNICGVFYANTTDKMDNLKDPNNSIDPVDPGFLVDPADSFI